MRTCTVRDERAGDEAAIAALTAVAPSSVAFTLDSAPWKPPMGVRAKEQMTTGSEGWVMVECPWGGTKSGDVAVRHSSLRRWRPRASGVPSAPQQVTSSTVQPAPISCIRYSKKAQPSGAVSGVGSVRMS